LQTLIAEIANLRKESSETKKFLTSVQEKLNAVLESIYPPPARGEFDAFPRLPIELRDKLWDNALNVTRIVGASLVVRDRNEEYKTLTSTAPFSPLLLTNKESRVRAKKILVCLTEKEPQYRVPLLYTHPKLDTLWITNYDAEGTKDTLISKVVFGGEKITKLAIPCKTWTDVLFQHSVKEIVDLVIRIQSKGIKDVTLVIRVGKTAKCSDIDFIAPREMLDWHVAPGWTEDLKEYFGVDEFTWSQSDIFANQLAAQARDEYMANAGLIQGTY
jgi:hypothetical protein